MRKYTHNSLLLLCLTWFLLWSCKPTIKAALPELGFYYWKSSFTLNTFEQKKIDSLGTKTLFVKFFDVVWNSNSNSAEPVAILTANTNDTTVFKINSGCRYAVAPTVFITNEALANLPDSGITTLANRIYKLTTNILSRHGFNDVAEYQFDCDWTAQTKVKYFALLTAIKALQKNTRTPISATIRLHQIKFADKTGVPPVDKGLLMCYNMGNLKNSSSNNSIIDDKVFEQYMAKLPYYSLPLDIALPLFEWKVWFKGNQFKGLLSHLPDSLLTPSFCQFNQNKITFLKDTFLAGQRFETGDMLRIEKSDKAAITNITHHLAKQLKQTPKRVLYYAIDSVILSKFYTHEMVQWNRNITGY